uniref:Uncharacterized protein n=1 Tax=Avena sativa TaxID=4498 RepID=A0ACD5XZK0_AVESA
MANTRSGGANNDGAGDTGAGPSTRKGSAAAKAKDSKSATTSSSSATARESRSSSAHETSDVRQPNLRRSNRETRGKNPNLETTISPASTPVSQKSTRGRSSGSTPETPESSAKMLKGVAGSTGKASTTRMSDRVKNASVSASTASKDSNGMSSPVATPHKTAKRQTDGHNSMNKKHDATDSGTRPSKKQRRLTAKSYTKLFRPSSEEKEKSPDDEGNASKVHMEDNGALLGREGSGGQEKVNQEGYTSGLFEASDVILETHMTTNLCSQNNVAESSPAKEEPTDDSNRTFLPEPQSSPNSTIHSKEAKKAIEEHISIEIREACTSKQAEVTQYDETNCNKHICDICRSAEIPGILKSCDRNGCKRKYHLSCLGLPVECVSPGIWRCSMCTKERLLCGVYSVSEGIESLWDVKEGVQNCKQYFVKYKNLAHVHNRWIPEGDIIDSTPGGHNLVSKFSKKIQKEKTTMWRQEWVEPHRLLKKRSLMPPEEAEDFFHSVGNKLVFCNVEWLVKWKGLGYEHVTWELETSSFLFTPEAEELKRSYETRRVAARKASDTAKINKVKQSPFQKLLKLPDGYPIGLDNIHLSLLNQLREFWHNSHGAILVDDKERVIKTILFAMSILPDVCRPLLIVSTSSSLALWEAKFNRLAPSINVVVYNGEKGARITIQDLEFYEKGSVMLQVLLSHPDAIIEDIETMKCIGWEAVIVDDCQSSRFLKFLEQLKCLQTDFRMVLLSSPLKENILDYVNLLSFLSSEGNDISSISNVDLSIDTPGTMAMLKSKLTLHVAFERKGDSSKFVEYWVPARLSRVQLEIYCHTLLSNSPALQSHSKTDSVGALRDILISLRKCCDHPYLVDETLQVSLIKGHPASDILDMGVHASGKLLLLDKMLREIREKGLRVIILSQSGGGAGNPMGDIFDDFVRQRFGLESYERVERGLHERKKQSAMSMFNDKTKGRFIFLIDSRACVPSIKLSLVDVIIIYGSDWNPTNDLRVLKKISIESQSEHVPIFRLYSSCTVEEKALILAKHDHTVDSNIQNITPISSHSLLSWGASFLFSRLEKLQNNAFSSKDSDAEKLFMDKVILEYLTKLSTEVDASTKMNNAVISQAHLRGPSYSSDSAVVGEREGISAPDGDLPKFCTFWVNLLDGKSPRWQYITEPGQRCRRKIPNTEEGKIPANETDEGSMKRRKIAETVDSSANVVAGKDKDCMLPEIKATSSSQQISVDDTWQEQGVENLQGTQKGLHVQLKPELSKLYKLLELPGSVICLCEELLEYTLKNHQVSQEPKGILHAFNIALCWRAASLLKHKVNRRESLSLAAKHLNYECNEDLAEFVYEKLRILKKKFSRRIGETSKHNRSSSVKNISPNQQEASTKLGNDESIPNQVAYVDCNLQNGSNQEDPHDLFIEAMVPREKELLSVPEFHEKHLSKDVLLNRIMEKKINLVNMVFSLREKNIHDKQANEVAVFTMNRQKEVLKLREACKIVVEHLRRSYAGPDDSDAKIKLIVEWFTMLLYAFLEHIRYQREKLDLQQSAVWAEELLLKGKYLQDAKLGQLDHTFDQDISLPDSGFVMEEFNHFSCCVDTATLANCPQSLGDPSAMEITLVRSVIPSEVISAGAVSAETFIQTERRQESEDNGLTEKRIKNSSDCIDSRGGVSLAVQHTYVQHTSSSSPAIDSWINQDSSTGYHGSTEHVEGETDVGSQRLLGGTDHHLGDAEREVNTGSRDSTLADRPHLEQQTVAPVPSQAFEQMSQEVETRTNLVMQSAQSSVVPAQLLQREAEQAGVSGEAPTQILQVEMQPSVPREADTRTDLIIQSARPSMVPAQLSGVAQAALSRVPSAQRLLSGMQPSIPVSSVLVQRTHFDRSQQSNQPEDVLGSSAQLFSVASIMFNHPPVGDEPLKNELHRLRLYIDSLNKTHELKQSQLRTECSQEIEKVKQKYDLLLQEQDSTHLQQRKTLDGLCEKVLLNQSLADDFRAKFISSSGAQGRAHSPPNHQIPQVSQQVPTRPSAVASTASAIALSSAGGPPVPPRPVQTLHVDRPSSSLQVSRSSLPSPQMVRSRPSIPGNLIRSTSVPFSHTPVLPRGSFGVQSELARAPAPHLQRRLSPRVHSIAPANQPQRPTRLDGSTSARAQSIPVTPVNIRQSSLHPISNPIVPAPLGPSSSHPARLPSPVSSVPNPALQLTSPPGFTRVSSVPSVTPDVLPSRKVGHSPLGMLQSDSDSVSLDEWLAGSLGLSSDPRGSAAPNDVVCLSDDE